MWHKALGRVADRTIERAFCLCRGVARHERIRQGIPSPSLPRGRKRDPYSTLSRLVAYVEEHGPCRAREAAVAVYGAYTRKAAVHAAAMIHGAWKEGRLTRLARGLYDRVASPAPASVMGRLVAHVEAQGVCRASAAVGAVLGEGAPRSARRSAYAALAQASTEGRLWRVERGVYGGIGGAK
jgi:hypothetical protein